MTARKMEAHVDNLHEVVATLRPDLRLVSRRELDLAIALMIEARDRARPDSELDALMRLMRDPDSDPPG